MKSILSTIAVSLLLLSCQGQPKDNPKPVSDIDLTAMKGEAVATFASGCFWCVEEVFESIKGVREAVSGYSGGQIKNPTYKQVGSGATKHAEAVQVYYDPNVVSFSTLVDAYYTSHDPTMVNGQAPDWGPQYRSIAFYRTEEEKEIIQGSIDMLTSLGVYGKPIATEVTKFDVFYPAEDYHQDFVKRNPNQGYVRAVSIPRFEKFKSKFKAEYLK